LLYQEPEKDPNFDHLPMKKFLKKHSIFFSVLVIFSLFLSLPTGLRKTIEKGIVVNAQSTEEKLQKLQEEIQRYESEIARLKTQAATLANQIAQYDAQINLTTLKISETQEKIELLGGRIDQLEVSLGSLTEAFSTRATETYKMSRINEPFLYLLSASDVKEAVSRYYYLKRIQEADRSLLLRLQKAQTVYKGEKEDQEDLQNQLKIQKANLDAQKRAKANLLEVTKNDEKKYQQLLAAARAEYEAIQAITAGKGEEEEVRHVNEGERIASIIQGPSCNSSGAHLHFIVRQGTTTLNPFAYLNASVSYENCSGSSCGSGDGDPFSPSGSWNWPINSPVKFSQGYGSTWAVQNTWVGRIYSFHNGIDINNEGNSTVKAVKAGTLYRGSYTGYQGCRLRYVRVDHDDSDLDTLYLHINY
jgi:peptidoglycan hydrolase CwlO-like protein